ncbi:hypothetical protein ACVIKO_006536 [Rhizobium ruizarguesonis]
MISFIDEHRAVFGVEPICRLLPIAPSTYYENVAKRVDVDRLSIRARRDISLKIEIRRVFEQNYRVYGVRKVWRQLKREGFDVARCTRRSAYEVDEPARYHSGKADPHDVPRQNGSEPTGPREPTVQGSCAQQAVGFRFHLWCASPQPGRHMTGMQRERRNWIFACPLLRGGMSPSGGDLPSTGRVT